MHEEIKVGEIIAKFDISGRDRSWRDYRQIQYLAKFDRLVYSNLQVGKNT